MKQMGLFLTISLTLAGCQMRQRTRVAGDLTERLAALEQSRLAAAAESNRSPLLQEDAAGLSLPGDGGAGDGSLRFESTWKQSAAPWTLGDLGDAQLLDEDPVSGEYDDRTEKEAPFLRRPPLDSFWATVRRDLKNAPADLWRDTKRVYANPLNLVILGTAYGGSLALQESGPDDTVEDHFRRDRPFGRKDIHRHFSSGWRDAIGAAGNPATHFALAGIWYLAGQQTSDDKTYEVGKTLFSALTINGLTVLAGQTLSGDRSPNGERGSFPSGHTSSTFVIASVLDEAYGPVVGVPLYLLGGLVAHERLEDNEHRLSDVVMGAVIGTVVGHAVASGRDPEFFGWKLMPYVSPNGATGVALMKTLP